MAQSRQIRQSRPDAWQQPDARTLVFKLELVRQEVQNGANTLLSVNQDVLLAPMSIG